MRLGSWMRRVCLMTSALQAAEVSGLVLDPSGGVMAGLVVRLECRNAAPLDTLTNDEGRFRIETPQSQCEVVIDITGFRAVRVRAGSAMRIELAIAEQRAEVTVNDVVTSNMDTVVLERSTLARLPVLGNDVLATVAELLDAPALGAGGGSIVVDGLEGPLKKIPAKLIQEVRINQSPYSAEYTRPGRGRIEVTTRKGEPEIHGSLAFQIRDSALDARNAFAFTRPDEQRREWSGSLTGPLHRRSKTTFFTSFEREAADEQTLVLAQTPEGEVRQNWPVPGREMEWNIRVSRPTASGGAITLRYEAGGEAADNEGVGGFALPETAANSRERQHTLRYGQRMIFSPHLVAEFQAEGEYSTERVTSRLPRTPRVVVEDAFTSGGAQADRLVTEVEAHVAGVLSWNRGRHLVKSGVQLPEWTREGWSDRTNRDGTWSFASLSDYLAARPYSFQQQAGIARFINTQRDLGLFVQHDMRVGARLNLSWGLRYEWQSLIADRNNLAPRIAAAWALDPERRLVIRAGGGIFYDRASSGDWADVLRSDPSLVRQILISNPGYPDPFAGGSADAPLPANIVRFAPELRSPYAMHYSVGAEWSTGAKSMFTATYIGARGVKLFRSRDANAPLGSVRPNPALAIVRVVESSADRKSRAVELSWRGPVFRFVDATVRYTLARTRDNTGGLEWLPPDSRDLSREWARSDEDQRHRLQVLASTAEWYGFALGAVLRIDSGRPYGFTTGRDDNGDGRATDRPAGLGRNSEQGFGAARLDVRLTREFDLGRWSEAAEPAMELRFDAFNILNRVNFGSPVGNLRSPYFGQPVSAAAARRLQLSIDFSF
jgi:hypothetical protein